MMSESEMNQSERRQGTQEMVDKLLHERQEMLALFCRVAGLEPYEANKPTIERLQEFCQILIDYSAFGHFEIYARIGSGKERRDEVIKVAEDVYPRILEASEMAVDFNDKYDSATHTLHLEHLADDLSKLGEELAMRVEMEDRIITALVA